MVKVAHFSFSEEFFCCKILFMLVVMDSKVIAQKSLIMQKNSAVMSGHMIPAENDAL